MSKSQTESWEAAELSRCRRQLRVIPLIAELRNSRPVDACIIHITGTCTASDLEGVKKRVKKEKEGGGQERPGTGGV